jgi:hypothetical protein
MPVPTHTQTHACMHPHDPPPPSLPAQAELQVAEFSDSRPRHESPNSGNFTRQWTLDTFPVWTPAASVIFLLARISNYVLLARISNYVLHILHILHINTKSFHLLFNHFSCLLVLIHSNTILSSHAHFRTNFLYSFIFCMSYRFYCTVFECYFVYYAY